MDNGHGDSHPQSHHLPPGPPIQLAYPLAAPQPQPQPVSVASSSTRRSRAAQPLSPSAAEEKRIKARERQRRKRERDRSGRDKSSIGGPGGNGVPHPSSSSYASVAADEGLTPDEAAKKERMRSAARERQRKHRANVKAKRMAELGLAIVGPGTAAQDYYAQAAAAHGQGGGEPPFPAHHPQQSGGQTFASTLMLSFSCATPLKQTLLRTLNMTDEDLVEFEPIIAAAWDQWNSERTQFPPVSSSQHPGPFVPYTPAGLPNDFRARFHRPLTTPFPPPPPMLRAERTASDSDGDGEDEEELADEDEGVVVDPALQQDVQAPQ